MLTAQITDIANDLYTSYALQKGFVVSPLLKFEMYDVEELNKRALSGKGTDLMKVSCSVLPKILDEYISLCVGGAFVKELSPKLVWGQKASVKPLESCELLVPGVHTTAFLLTRIFFPEAKNFCVMPYHEILELLSSGDERPALLIHSAEDIEKKYCLREFASLSSLWFANTQAEFLPLGCLVAKKSLGRDVLKQLTSCLRDSIEYSKAHEEEVFDWILSCSPQLSRDALKNSVKAWVNKETFNLSEKGEESLKILMEKASSTFSYQNKPLVFKDKTYDVIYCNNWKICS